MNAAVLLPQKEAHPFFFFGTRDRSIQTVAFNNAMGIRMCGYFINRNNQLLQGKVHIVDSVVVIADVAVLAVDAMVMKNNNTISISNFKPDT